MNSTIAQIERVGGCLCLDFVNTRASHFDADAREYIGNYAELVAWLRGCENGLEARESTQLLANARTHPRRAAAVFTEALALRDLLYRVLAAQAGGDAPARADLEAFNRAAAAALAQRRLVSGTHWHWEWSDTGALELPLWKVLASAVDLLVESEPERLKQCPAPDGCGWLFHDTSKNRTRRWCSMRMCGNGAKARRFQHRQRESAD